MGTGNDGEHDQPSGPNTTDEKEEGQEPQLSDDSQSLEYNVPQVNGADTFECHGAVRMINTAVDDIEEPDEFSARMSSGCHEGITTSSANRPGVTLAEVEADDQEPIPRWRARTSTSTKLPVTKEITPPLATHMTGGRAMMDQALEKIMERMSEQ